MTFGNLAGAPAFSFGAAPAAGTTAAAPAAGAFTFGAPASAPAAGAAGAAPVSFSFGAPKGVYSITLVHVIFDRTSLVTITRFLPNHQY